MFNEGMAGADDSGQELTGASAPVESNVQPEIAPEVKPDTNEAQDWKAKYDGIQGVFRTERERAKRLEAEVNEFKARVQAAEAERQRQAQEAEEKRLRELIDDPEELATELRTRLDRQKAEREFHERFAPQFESQAQQRIRQAYEEGIFEAAEEMGLSRDEVASLAKDTDFKGFIKQFGKKAVEKQLNPTMKDMRESLAQQLRAELRGGELPPDTGGSGSRAAFSSFREAEDAWLSGKLGDADYRSLRKKHLTD